ncbi:MAG: hypothetical protein HY067_06770 [Betaproteobacteria bacterium]|nr:hypothetical protein [Betaproteobacteria bacterium]
MQTLIAYFIVALAIIYAGWLFMPQTMRRWLIARLITLAPASQRARFTRLQSGAESVGCSTCKGCATDAQPASRVETIQLHRR